MTDTPFAPIPEVLAALQRGEMIVLVDDEARENEGDLVMLADRAGEDAIAFMATKGCGLICLAMAGPMLDRLGLPLMTRDNRSMLATAFTLSIDGAEGVTTGISAGDRARTIAAAIADDARPEHVVSPGHVFPLRARDGGVLVRAGHSEASVDLARLCGSRPAGVICEIMLPDGKMARLPDLIPYAQEHGLLLASIADLIAYREARESLVELAAEQQSTVDGTPVHIYAYRSVISDELHVAVVVGEQLGPGRCAQEPVTVRVQQESVLGDLIGVTDAGAQGYLRQVVASGEGVLLYIRDGHGHRLLTQMQGRGAAVHHRGPLPVSGMDPRTYGIGAQILHHLGVRDMRLISSSDRHIKALRGYDLSIVERIPPAHLDEDDELEHDHVA